MSFELITLDANGQRYSEWKSVEVVAAYTLGAVEFAIETTEVTEALESPFAKWKFPPRTQVDLRANGDLLVSGRIVEYQPRGFPNNHQVICTGAGESTVLINSSPFHPTGFFEGKTLLQIAQTLAGPFGIAVKLAGLAAEVASQPIPVFGIRRGSTVWGELVRLAQEHGVTIYGDPEGGIEIIRGTVDMHAGAIVQGGAAGTIPIKAMSAVLADQFPQELRTVGQSALGTQDANREPEGIATNPKADRYSLFETVNPEESDPAKLQQQADWLMLRAIGESAEATVTVPTFRDTAGKLWRAGNSVFLHAGWLKLSQMMAIKQVTFRQDSIGGTVAELQLVDPRALGAEGIGDSDSGSEYDLYPD